MKMRFVFNQIFITIIVFLFLGGWSTQIWALRYGKGVVYSSPAQGGWVWVTKTSGNAPSAWDKTSDESSDDNTKIKDYTFHFYYYANPQTNYVFKGWASESGTNTTVSTTRTNWDVGVTATSSNNANWKPATATYYAIFGRLTTENNVSSLTFSKYVDEGWGDAKSVRIRYVHAGNITANITGTNKTDFSFSKTSSSQSKNLVSNNTDTEDTVSVTVYFNPSAEGTRSAKLTFSGNGMTKEVTLTGTGNKQNQSLSWENESDIVLNMLSGTSQSISAKATSGLTVSYASTNNGVLSVSSNGQLTANTVGNGIIITASQSGNYKYNAAKSITKTFNVKSKDTPIFTPVDFNATETNNLLVGQKVTMTVANVSDGLSGDFKAWATKDNGKNILAFTRSGNTVTIEALNAGSSTATLGQKENSTIFGDTVNYVFNVAKVENTLSVTSAYSPYVGDTIKNVISNKNSDAVVTTTSTAPGIAYYDVNADRIYIPNSNSVLFGCSTTVTIHIKQDTTYKYKAVDKTITLTVKKYPNTIRVKGQDNYHSELYFDSYDNQLTFSTSNPDMVGSPLEFEHLSGHTIATYYDADKVIYSGHNIGSAEWRVSQPENYKYQYGSNTFSVNVRLAAEATNCYLLDAPDEHSYGKYGDSEHNQWQEFSWSGMPKELKFKMWKYSNANDIGNHVYVYDANGNELANHEYAIASISTSAQDYTVQLPENARKVKFQNGAGTYVGSSSFNTYVSNILVTRKTYLTVPNITITKQADGNTDIFPDDEGKGTLAINYSLANGGPLKIYCDNSHFTFTNNRTNATSNYVSLGDLGCSGSTLNIPVYYNATAIGTENANVVIYNDVYRTTATITATTQPRIQSITWKYTMLRLGTSVSDAASAHNLITYASSDPSIIRVDKDANGYETILTPLAEGTATITATAAADAEYAQAVSSQSIKVTTKQIQTIVWNQNLFGLKLGGSNVPLKAYATSDVEDCTSNGARTITYTSSDTSVVSIVNGNNLKIEGVGRAIITATQAGTAEGFDDGDGHEYEAISAEKTAIVRDPNEPCNSYVYEQENEYRFELGWNAANKQTKTKEIDFNGIEPDICTFRYKGEAKTVAIEYYDGTMTVEQYLNGGWHELINLGKPLKSEYSNTTDKGIIQFDRNATKMRIKVKNGLGYQYFTDCQVTQARYIETTAPVAFAANVGQTITQDIYLSYSNITDNLNLSMGQGANSHFSVDRTFIEGTCGDRAKNVRLTISYYSDTEETDAEDNLIITDGTTTCRVALTATASRANRNITWNHADVTDIYTVQTETLSAEAYTNINILAGEVVFSIGGSSTASASISQENVLSFSSAGVVYVTANTREDARYNPAQYITKRWNVSTTPTSINVAPTAADITYGAAMGDIKLSGGSAVNTVNGNTVEGSFSVVSADMSSYGPKTITVAFIPDNTAMYDSCHTTIPLMINKAVSVATPTAAAIDYGAAVSTSELSNTGTAGTWTWTDARQNEVLPADTYSGLSVHFTPDNSNYTELDATVELTVNAIMPDLAWITALTSFAYDATGIVYTAASNNSAGEITYSIVSGTCADIDSNSGALTIASAGYITVRATIAANGNYTAKYIDIDVHITSPNNFTNADGDGDWHNPNNWTSGSVPEESVPNVFVSGELEIDSSLTVGSLTIENTGSITVIRNCTLTVTGASDYRDEYGDIVVSTGAVLDVTGKLKARDFMLTAAIGSRTVGAQSGQVLDPATLDIKGNAYFELALDPRGECSQGWYDFTVPFPVDATSGVSRWENGVLNNNLKYGTNYALMEFSEPTRATGAYPWKKFRGVMQPGICYTITIDDVHNVYRFKKTEQGAFNLSSFLTMTATSSAPLVDRGWNGIGNGTLAHADLSAAGVDKVQLYDHITNSYSAVDINDYTYVVGSAFFAQVPSERPMNFNTPTNRTLRTPARSDDRTGEYVVTVKREGQKHFDDRLYFSADESADNTYEIGHDLAKLGTFTEAASAQMWSTSYGMTLCDVELPLANDMAETPVSFFAPKAGDYTLYVEKAPEDGTSLYLVHNGIQVWNIGLEPYTLSLKKGVTTGYSLRIVASDIQHTPTDIQTSDADNVDTVLKYINNGCIYIQCGDRIYDSKGSVIK